MFFYCFLIVFKAYLYKDRAIDISIRRGIKMKKQKQFVLVIIMLVILTTISLSGCVDEKSKFIGTWRTAGGETTITFTSTTATIVGTGPLGVTSLTGSFNYTIANNKITFSSGGTLGITLNYSFSGSTLVISNDAGNSVIFTKV